MRTDKDHKSSLVAKEVVMRDVKSFGKRSSNFLSGKVQMRPEADPFVELSIPTAAFVHF